MVHWDLVRGVRIPLEDVVLVLTLRDTSCVEVVEGHSVDECRSAPCAERFYFVDWSFRLSRNVQVFATNIISEEHKAKLLMTVTIVALRTVQSLCFAVNVRVSKPNLQIFTIFTSLQTHSLQGVDDCDVVGPDLIHGVEGG